MERYFIIQYLLVSLFTKASAQVNWLHLSSRTGDIEAPNPDKQQTSHAVGDFDNDGIIDLGIGERTSAPGLDIWPRQKPE
jgi:hypothetical protein